MQSIRRLSGGLLSSPSVGELEPCRRQWVAAHINLPTNQTIIRADNIGLSQLKAMLKWLEGAKAWVYYCSQIQAIFIKRMTEDRKFICSREVRSHTYYSGNSHKSGTDTYSCLSSAIIAWKHIGTNLSSLEKSLQQLEVYLGTTQPSDYPSKIPIDLMQKIGKLTKIFLSWNPPRIQFWITPILVSFSSDEIESLDAEILSNPYTQSNTGKVPTTFEPSLAQTSSEREVRSAINCTFQRATGMPLRISTVFIYEAENTLTTEIGMLSDLVEHAITEAEEIVRRAKTLITENVFPMFI